jgi:hypothetical protein
LPLDKAPGPDGFSTRFPGPHACDSFWYLDTRNLQSVNEALLTQLPKSPEASKVTDYHPISLIHIVGKLLSKFLANQLAPKLNNLVHISQSAFKGHFIQDNFKLVQSTAKLLHLRKCPSLLLKIDIAKAFDSVAWPFLLDILEYLGFPRTWRDWISCLMSSASTRIIMNGNPGEMICHARGLRQSDPLLPMLFLLTMEVLGALIRKADGWSLQ